MPKTESTSRCLVVRLCAAIFPPQRKTGGNSRNTRPCAAEKRRTREIMGDHERLLERLEQIRLRYDLAEEASEIDALIYEENAVQCRLSALYAKARQWGVHVEHYERRRS